ncbi:ATP-binding protein [Streptomyces sp. NPDC097727]|uniref:ATP-binding protein n=1 Tax=Streptomyces sp. NPDC097727 TaxID=3366092 RepID=UPI00381DF2BA
MKTSQVQPPLAVREFTHTFPTTRLGASLARRTAMSTLGDWGVPPGSPLSDTVALLVAELAANAARHGRVPGRNFELRLLYEHAANAVHVEVSDTHPRRPDPTTATMADPDADGGRGLALVEAIAHRWGVEDRTGPGKTVWAQTKPTDPPDPTRPQLHDHHPA